MTGITVPGVELRVFQELFSMELVNEWMNEWIVEWMNESINQ